MVRLVVMAPSAALLGGLPGMVAFAVFVTMLRAALDLSALAMRSARTGRP
jgi:hypothetical protein